MRLIVDTATSGGWKYGSGIPDQEQPYMTRLAWLLEDEHGNALGDACHLVRLPEGQRIVTDAQRATGIAQHHLEDTVISRSLRDVLDEFSWALAEVLKSNGQMVAHAWSHHRQVLERSYRLAGLPAREWPRYFDVMVRGANVVRVPQPGRRDWKYPSFTECCRKFFPNGYLDCVTANGEFMPTTNPITDGFSRVHIVRTFYLNIASADS